MSRIDDLIRWETEHEKRARKREKREAKAAAERQEKLIAAFKELLPSLLPAIGQILMPGAFSPEEREARPTPSVPEGWPFTPEELSQIIQATKSGELSVIFNIFDAHFTPKGGKSESQDKA